MSPEFSDVQISTAGEVRRPEVDLAPEDIRDLAYPIVRVFNRDGEAVGPRANCWSSGEALAHYAPALAGLPARARAMMV